MIKEKILNLGFVRRAINEARIEGTDFGVQQSQDSMERFRITVQKLHEQLKSKPVLDVGDVDKLVNERISKLLGVVDENFVVTLDKKTGLVFMGGVRLEEQQILNLRSEANAITAMQIWPMLSETLKKQAQETIFNKSTEWADVVNGKVMLYCLSLQQKILDIFKSYKPKPKP